MLQQHNPDELPVLQPQQPRAIGSDQLKRPPQRKHASVPEGQDGSEDAPREAECDESENCRNQRWRHGSPFAATEQMSPVVISAHL